LETQQILRLQRLAGNAAVCGLLSRAGATVQRDTELERGQKFARKATARALIPGIAAKVVAGLKNHVQLGTPVNGGAIDRAHPQGLHVYTGGNLPGDATVLKTKGSKSGVHQIKWRWGTQGTGKESTMFPQWMPLNHALALMALHYPTDGAVVSPALTNEELAAKSKVIKYVSLGHTINLGKAGETVYPKMGG
jgi:hypothetical protein